MYYWILEHSKWICPLLALHCCVVYWTVVHNTRQRQAAKSTDRQNILFFQSKRHRLCLSVLLPVGDRLVWIRACGNRTRMVCRVVSCRAVWCESTLKQVLLSCPMTVWCRVLLSFHLSLFQGDKRIFDSGECSHKEIGSSVVDWSVFLRVNCVILVRSNVFDIPIRNTTRTYWILKVTHGFCSKVIFKSVNAKFWSCKPVVQLYIF